MSEAATDYAPVSVRVAEALADAAGTDPVALEPPLQSAIDPDALDALVASDAEARVEFEYDGRRVTVRADGTVVVGDDLQHGHRLTPD
jgi:hypothetical protein